MCEIEVVFETNPVYPTHACTHLFSIRYRAASVERPGCVRGDLAALGGGGGGGSSSSSSGGGGDGGGGNSVGANPSSAILLDDDSRTCGWCWGDPLIPASGYDASLTRVVYSDVLFVTHLIDFDFLHAQPLILQHALQTAKSSVVAIGRLIAKFCDVSVNGDLSLRWVELQRNAVQATLLRIVCECKSIANEATVWQIIQGVMWDSSGIWSDQTITQHCIDVTQVSTHRKLWYV